MCSKSGKHALDDDGDDSEMSAQPTPAQQRRRKKPKQNKKNLSIIFDTSEANMVPENIISDNDSGELVVIDTNPNSNNLGKATIKKRKGRDAQITDNQRVIEHINKNIDFTSVNLPPKIDILPQPQSFDNLNGNLNIMNENANNLGFSNHINTWQPNPNFMGPQLFPQNFGQNQSTYSQFMPNANAENMFTTNTNAQYMQPNNFMFGQNANAFTNSGLGQNAFSTNPNVQNAQIFRMMQQMFNSQTNERAEIMKRTKQAKNMCTAPELHTLRMFADSENAQCTIPQIELECEKYKKQEKDGLNHVVAMSNPGIQTATIISTDEIVTNALRQQLTQINFALSQPNINAQQRNNMNAMTTNINNRLTRIRQLQLSSLKDICERQVSVNPFSNGRRVNKIALHAIKHKLSFGEAVIHSGKNFVIDAKEASDNFAWKKSKNDYKKTTKTTKKTDKRVCREWKANGKCSFEEKNGKKCKFAHTSEEKTKKEE